MRDLAQAALQVQKLLDKQRWKYCFIGGLAVQKWGQVRLTDDIDLTLLTGFGAEEKYIDKLLSFFDARITNARAFAVQNRVLLLVDKNRIDIEGIIAKQTRSKLDWKYVFTQLTPLAGLKEEPEILPKLRALRDES